ncbi:MAG: HAD family hydrolase [Bdellovibrionales bacterium]|nr:HAD family hydrolase [Bdellovibrionales bacterium]
MHHDLYTTYFLIFVDEQWAFLKNKETGHLNFLSFDQCQASHNKPSIESFLNRTFQDRIHHWIPLNFQPTSLFPELNQSTICYVELKDLPESQRNNFEFFSSLADITEGLLSHKSEALLKQSSLKTQLIQKTRPYKQIIWDWNGTLIDDVEVALLSMKTLLSDHNLPDLCVDRYRDVFGFPIQKYYEKLGFDFDSICFNSLCYRFHEEYDKNRLKVGKLFADVIPHLDLFSKTKKQSILSAGAQWHLDEWVQHYNIKHFFEYIYGISDHFAGSKIDRGRELITHSKYDPSDTILIGDTDHDVEVGAELGVDVLLIANGHQSFERLQQLHDNVIER